jgi:hypothetical protein
MDYNRSMVKNNDIYTSIYIRNNAYYHQIGSIYEYSLDMDNLWAILKRYTNNYE